MVNGILFPSSAALLDGLANTGLVELGEVQVAKYLAEKTFTGQPSFPNGTFYLTNSFLVRKNVSHIRMYQEPEYFYELYIEKRKEDLQFFDKK